MKKKKKRKRRKRKDRERERARAHGPCVQGETSRDDALLDHFNCRGVYLFGTLP